MPTKKSDDKKRVAKRTGSKIGAKKTGAKNGTAKKRAPYKNGKGKRNAPADRILDVMSRVADIAVSEGVAPWNPGRLTSLPRNGISGRHYKGAVNLLHIFLYGRMHGFADSRFVPIGALKAIAKETEGLDWRGAHAVPICRPVAFTKRVEDETDGSEEVSGVFYKWFYAINAGEIEGPIEDHLKPIDFFGLASGEDMVSECQASLLARFKNPPDVHTRGMIDSPRYLPGSHKIEMPEIGYYLSREHYLRDFTHELCHATQRELGRIYGDGQSCDKDDAEYAWEELAAHLATVGVMLEYGLTFEERREADYVRGWHGALSADPGLLRRALAEAGRITGFLAAPRAADAVGDMEKAA